MVLEMSEMSKTYQYRKVMKPMLERKRRARINKCLDALKDYMVEYLTQAGEHIARLEKADILELTVEHMKKLRDKKELHLAGAAAAQDQKLIAESFRAGYVHAANEVSKTLAAFPGVSVDLGTQLMSHLGHRLNYLQVVVPSVSISAGVGAATPGVVQPNKTISTQLSSPTFLSSAPASPTPLDLQNDIAVTPPPSECDSSFGSSGSCSPAPSESSTNSMWRPW